MVFYKVNLLLVLAESTATRSSAGILFFSLHIIGIYPKWCMFSVTPNSTAQFDHLVSNKLTSVRLHTNLMALTV